MRIPLLAGNWKMHGTVAEARALAASLKNRLADVEDRDVLIAPPFPALAAVAESLEGTRLLLAAQNLHWEDCGAYTGEVSAPMLVAAGCTHVIVGHSERRQYFGDTDEWVCRKVKAALRHDLFPILCVGETLQEREANRVIEIIREQIRPRAGRAGHRIHRPSRRRLRASLGDRNRQGRDARASTTGACRDPTPDRAAQPRGCCPTDENPLWRQRQAREPPTWSRCASPTWTARSSAAQVSTLTTSPVSCVLNPPSFRMKELPSCTR